MTRPRRFAHVAAARLIVLLLPLLAVSCSHSPSPTPESESGAFRSGRGEAAPTARDLVADKLNQQLATRGSERAAAGADAPEEEVEEGRTETALRRAEPAPVMRPAPVAPARSPVASGDKSAAGGTPAKTSPTTKQWQRAAHRPAFARVYVGGGNALELVRMRVTVRIEGARARTVVDHIFRNPHDRQLEGTFEYPLPPNASASYYAMFLTGEQTETPEFFPRRELADLPPGALASMAPPDVGRRVHQPTWGALREGRVVPRETGRRVYEQIVRRKIDPALLEYASGNTFRGRVFPIQPKGLSRVIVAYEEHLDFAGDAIRYRFPLPDCPLELLHVTATLPEAEARADRWAPADGAVRRVADGRIVYEQAWETTRGPGGEVVLAWTPTSDTVQAAAGLDPTRAGSAWYARVRPQLAADLERPWASRAVFLLDTSLSEYPDRFNANLAVMRCILESDAAIERFNVMCFDVGAWWIARDGWISNDAAGRARAFAALDQVLLEGATDLGVALEQLAAARFDAGEERANVNVFLLTDGQVNWGERDADRMLAAFDQRASVETRFFCYRTGLGAENTELFDKLTRRGGGVFNVFNESMATEAALAHRRPCLVVDEVQVTDANGTLAGDVVVAGRRASVYPGGELVVAWRDDSADAAALAAAVYHVVVRGRLQGEVKELSFPVAANTAGELAPRAWAEIAVNQMLAAGDPDLEPLATAYAQQFRIGSRVTSFLVLEADADYKRFGIDAEAGKLKVADVGRFLAARIAARVAALTRKQAFQRFLARVAQRVGLERSDKAAHVQALVELLDEAAFALPRGAAPAALPAKSVAGPAYLEAREKQRREVSSYVTEAERRRREGHAFDALRALSSVVELYPGRSDALRLVGYRLLALEEPGYAAGLFDRVRESRPFEPHSYRDLARSLEAAGRPGLAAVYYEIVLAGSWHERFHQSLKVVVLEEYCRMMRNAITAGAVGRALVERFGERLEKLARTVTAADLVVTSTWNTDNTDVDLWVVDPSGEACGYNHKKTAMGGELLDDLTGGYGPERFRLVKAAPGEFSILVHYYSTNPNLLAGESYVEIVVTRKAGTADAETRRYQVILSREKQAVEVCRVRF